jgi:hypothetical protein
VLSFATTPQHGTEKSPDFEDHKVKVHKVIARIMHKKELETKQKRKNGRWHKLFSFCIMLYDLMF